VRSDAKVGFIVFDITETKFFSKGCERLIVIWAEKVASRGLRNILTLLSETKIRMQSEGSLGKVPQHCRDEFT
jgi:hypothetical protein